MSSSSSEFDSWIESLDEAAIQHEVSDIDQHITTLQRHRARLVEAVALKQAWIEDRKGSAAEDSDGEAPRMVPVPGAHVPLDGPAPQGKTAAVLRILGSEPDRLWTAQEIRKIMVERGWMTAEQKDYASLMSTLSRMTNDAASGTPQIYRLGRGQYRLSPPNAGDA